MLLAPNAAVSATLKGWYDASTEVAANGSSIATAVDQSTYGKNLTQATAGFKPTIQTASDGRRYWLFDGSDDNLTGAAAADWKFLNDGTHTYFVVCELVAHSADGRSTVLDTGGLAIGNVGVWLAFDNRGGAGNAGPNGVQARATRNASPNDDYQLLTGDPTIAVGMRTIIAVRAGATLAEIRIFNQRGQRITDTTVSYGGTNPLGALRLAMRTSGTALPANLKLHEVSLFDGDLSDAEFDGIHEYLDQKWAVETWTADAANPITVENTATYDAFPSIVEASNGDLLAVARRGTSHTSLLGSIVQWRSTDQGATWSAEGVIFSGTTENLDLRDTGLTRLANGDLMLALSVRDAAGNNGTHGCRWALSSDDGATWGALNTLSDAFAGFSRASTRPLLMPNGDLLWPVYGNTSGSSSSTRWVKVYKSTDDATTWSYLADIGTSANATGWGETSIVRTSGGHLVALVRNDLIDALYRSVSTDDGATWSSLVVTSPVTSNVDAVLKNASSSPQAAYTQRGLLVAAQRDTSNIGWIVTSPDDGATWQRGSRLSTGTFEYGSPVVVGGLIVLLFSREASSADADVFVDRYTEFYSAPSMPLVVTLRGPTGAPLVSMPVEITLRGPVLPTGLPATLALGAIPRHANAGGLGIDATHVDPPPVGVALIDAADPDTVLSTLDDAKGLDFLVEFRGEGSGALIVANDDPDRALVDRGLLLRWSIEGVAAYLTRIEHLHQTTLDQSAERAGHLTNVEGRGALMALLSDAIVFPTRWLNAGPDPQPKEQDRTISFAVDPYDASAWGYATQLVRQGDDSPGWTSQPPASPDPNAYWIAPVGSTLISALDGGIWYVKRDFISASLDGSGVTKTRLYYNVDDFVTVFFDGQQVSETLDVDARDRLRKVDLDVSDGFHQLAFVVKNIEHWIPYNATGLWYSLQVLQNNLTVGVLYSTLTDPFTPVHSSNLDRVLAYPDEPPGVSIGSAILVLLFEMTAREINPFFDFDFTTLTDSNGEAWDLLPSISIRVGDKYSEVFSQWVEQGYVDLVMDPYRPLLHAYKPGTYTQSSGVRFTAGDGTEGVGDTTSLEHDELDPVATHMLVQWEGGMIELVAEDFDGDVERRIEGYVSVEANNEDEARTIGGKLVRRSRRPPEAISGGFHDEDAEHRPWVNPLLLPGNTVELPNKTVDGYDDEIMLNVRVQMSDDRQRLFTPEWKDVRQEHGDLLETWLRRQVPGGMGGIYGVTHRIEKASSSAQVADTPGFAFTLNADPDPVDADVHVRVQVRELIFSRTTGVNDPATVGVATMQLWIDGNLIVTLSIADGKSSAHISLVGLYDGMLQPGKNRMTAVLTQISFARHIATVTGEKVGDG